MKFKLTIAFLLFLTGAADIINWIVYSENNSILAKSNYSQFKENFIAHFPRFLQPLYKGYPAPASLILIVFFVTAGILFLGEKKLFYKIMAILSFVLGFWNLFSLM